MNKPIKKIIKKISLLCVCAAPLFHACESDFLKSAEEKLVPNVPKPAKMNWDYNKIYINPESYVIDANVGVMKGNISTSGNVWFKSNLPSTQGGYWSITGDGANEAGPYFAGSVAALLNGGTPSTGTKSSTVTLNFGTTGTCLTGIDQGGFPAGGLPLSFILTPYAFAGGDSASLITDNLTHDFKLVLPATKTEYAKAYLERYDFTTSIEVSLAVVNFTEAGDEAGSISAMQEYAGSMAAVTAVGSVSLLLPNATAAGTWGAEVRSWDPSPDKVIQAFMNDTGTPQNADYTLTLSLYYDAEGQTLPVKVFMPVQFKQ